MGFASVYGLRGDFDIDAGVLVEVESQTCPTVEHPGSQDLAEFGNQRVESGIRGRGSILGPDRLDELVWQSGRDADHS